MSDVIIFDEKLNIRNVKTFWDSLYAAESPAALDFSRLKKYDAAGLQFLIYINILALKTPSDYAITGVNDDLSSMLKDIKEKSINKEVI